MDIANWGDEKLTSERRQSGAEAGTRGENSAENAAGRARFNGLYAPRMAVSAQVSGAGKGPFEKGLTSGQLPRLEVLERSELLEPLDERGRGEFRWLLGLVEETETEGVGERVRRKWAEAVGKGGSLKSAVRTRFNELTGNVRTT